MTFASIRDKAVPPLDTSSLEVVEVINPGHIRTFHYVDHAQRILTPGFSNRSGLERNRDIVRNTLDARELMRDRYERNAARIIGASH